MDKSLFLDKEDLQKFLDTLCPDYEVYIPVKKNKHRFYKKYAGAINEIVVGEVRSFEPLKAFFSRAREVVAEGFKDSIPHANDKPFAVIGVKACDLKGFKVQDFVFKDQGFRDPAYIKNREQNLVISADCTCAIDTCYCLALGVKPHPQEDFDINLSEIEEGYVVAIDSPKGQAVIAKVPSLFKEATGRQITERDSQRAMAHQEVETNIKKYDVPLQEVFAGMVKRNYKSEMWNDEAKTCVECGACNTICPTCHCFLLFDQKDAEQMERFRIWDSCMIKDFARVAGGANPRPKLWARLRNRFEKKFDFFPKVAGVYACTGCGRCISACPAKIDIRRVLRRLANNG